MSWNNAYMKNKFEQFEKKQASEYRKAGMSEEVINKMYLFDYDLFCRERTFVRHTKSWFADDHFDEEINDDLCNNFLNVFSVQMLLFESNRYGWIEQIENQIMYDVLVSLTNEQKEILTLIYIYGFTETYIAKQVLQVSVSAVHYKLSAIYKKIALSFIEMGGFKNA